MVKHYSGLLTSSNTNTVLTEVVCCMDFFSSLYKNFLNNFTPKSISFSLSSSVLPKPHTILLHRHLPLIKHCKSTRRKLSVALHQLESPLSDAMHLGATHTDGK